MNKVLKIVSGYKFYLIVGCCLLVASIFLPFATMFTFSFITHQPQPQQAHRGSYWSFMHVQEVLEKGGDSWTVKKTYRWFFLDYWSWWGSGVGVTLQSRVLISIFVLQIAALLTGLSAFQKRRRSIDVWFLLFEVIALNFLYYYTTQIFRAKIGVGFLLSFMATVFIVTALVFALRIPKNIKRGSREDLFTTCDS